MKWTIGRVAASLIVAFLIGAAGSGPAGAVADPRDRAALSNAINDLMSFAAPGRSLRYENPETGNGGEVTALENVGRGTAECWDYRRTFEQDGRIMTVDGTACELDQGLWQIMEESEARATPDPVPSPQPMPAPGAASGGTPTVTPSQDRALVRETQQLLTDLGYNPGPVDGLFGSKTQTAISTYQRDAGLTRTGQPSAELLVRLRSNRQAAAPAPATQAQPQAMPAPQTSPQPAPQPSTAPSPAASQAPAPAPGTPIVVPPPPPPPPVPQ